MAWPRKPPFGRSDPPWRTVGGPSSPDLGFGVLNATTLGFMRIGWRRAGLSVSVVHRGPVMESLPRAELLRKPKNNMGP
eukprot:14565136-Alexandrium_andersonii.AAC.1